MSKNILITGCSSGLGLALSKLYLEQNFNVYGISRKKPEIEHENFKHLACDLSDILNIKKNCIKFINDIENIHAVFLNAGMLGEIKTLDELSINEMKEVYNLNVYANKELLDILSLINTKIVIAISSGAAVNGSKGWASYCLSKAGVNMLINLYAKEMTDTKLLAVAPGVIETPMTDYIRFEIDDEIFTSARRLKDGPIQKPFEAALKLNEIIEKIEEFESGSFIDVRNL